MRSLVSRRTPIADYDNDTDTSTSSVFSDDDLVDVTWNEIRPSANNDFTENDAGVMAELTIGRIMAAPLQLTWKEGWVGIPVGTRPRNPGTGHPSRWEPEPMRNRADDVPGTERSGPVAQVTGLGRAHPPSQWNPSQWETSRWKRADGNRADEKRANDVISNYRIQGRPRDSSQ